LQRVDIFKPIVPVGIGEYFGQWNDRTGDVFGFRHHLVWFGLLSFKKIHRLGLGFAFFALLIDD
jgi:hypothetical protein